MMTMATQEDTLHLVGSESDDFYEVDDDDDDNDDDHDDDHDNDNFQDDDHDDDHDNDDDDDNGHPSRRASPCPRRMHTADQRQEYVFFLKNTYIQIYRYTYLYTDAKNRSKGIEIYRCTDTCSWMHTADQRQEYVFFLKDTDIQIYR